MFDVTWEFLEDEGGDGICRGRVAASGGLIVRERPDVSSPAVGQLADGSITQIWWRTEGDFYNA